MVREPEYQALRTNCRGHPGELRETLGARRLLWTRRLPPLSPRNPFRVDAHGNRAHGASRRRRYSVSEGDAVTTRIDGSFDVVVSLAVIEHIPDVRAFAGRLVEFCRPGGVICVMTINEASVLYALARAARRVGVPLAFNRLYKRHHVQHFTTRSLVELFRCEHVVLERASPTTVCSRQRTFPSPRRRSTSSSVDRWL